MFDNKRITPVPEHVASEMLAKHYHPGDTIIHNLNEFTAISFGEKVVHRGGLNHKYAGTYIDFTKLRVVPKGGGEQQWINVGSREMRKSEFASQNKERDVGSFMHIYIRTGDLPDTPLWEGDTVVFAHDVSELHHTIQFVDDIMRQPLYSAVPIHLPDVQSPNFWYAQQFRLVARGNLWKMEHGEPMRFASIKEEAKFYQSLGMSHKVNDIIAARRMLEEHADSLEFRDAKEEADFFASQGVSHGVQNGYLSERVATFQEAVLALQGGIADQMKLKDSEAMTFTLIKYDNEEFGSRLRAHTLAKFGFTK